MRKTLVIDAIRQLEARGMIEAIRKLGTKTIYRIVLPEKTDSEPDNTRSVALNPTQPFSQVSQPFSRSGGTILPTPGNHSPTKSANQLPEPLEVPEGSLLRYTKKVERENARASLACATETEEGAAAPMTKERQTIPLPRSLSSNGVAAPTPEAMMDGKVLDQINRDPLYTGINVTKEAWKFKRNCVAKDRPQTVRNFKLWLSHC